MADPEVPVVEQQSQEPVVVAATAHNGPRNLEWPLMVVGFCFQSAVAIALQSLPQTGDELPITIHMVCLAMVVAVAALCVSIYISTKYPSGARALEHVGVLSGLTAFLLAVTIPFPLGLKLASWIIFALALSLVAILVYN